MDKSAKTITGLALSCFCLAIVWTLLGSDEPTGQIPFQAPTPSAPAILTPPPPAEKKPELVAFGFSSEHVAFSPQLYRLVKASEGRAETFTR